MEPEGSLPYSQVPATCNKYRTELEFTAYGILTP